MSNEPPLGQINYELLVESALRDVVRASLKIAEDGGLPGEAHFYITFLTAYPDVILPKHLKDSHPERMTIILQHQFWELKVGEDEFSVALSFGGTRETLTIPFMSVIDFSDPSVGFSLQFALEDDEDDEDSPKPDGKAETAPDSTSADVVSLDTFRKKT